MAPISRFSLLSLPLATCLSMTWACTQPDGSPVTPDADPSATAEPEDRGAFENPGGMWMPSQLAARDHVDNLVHAGFELDPAVLTVPTSFPLGAIVSLGGCSASFVSDQGLIITNHHCVQGALTRNSSEGENLIEDGFLAATRGEERWAGPSQRVYVTNSFTEVSDQVLAGLEDIGDPEARFDEMNKRRGDLADACEAAKEDVSCRVASYFEGAQFFLIEQLELRDIRLVHAPDAGVGVYGGEVDNWRWPRHTGDYSFFRAYVGPDGKPADFDDANVPFHPEHVLAIATEDLDEGDFVMVAGYPGRTSRLKTAAEVADAVDWSYPHKIARYEQYLAAIEAAAGDDPALKIIANPTVRGLGNGLTNAKGMLDGLGKGGLSAQKAAQEAELLAWIEADEQRKAAYGGVLAELDVLSRAYRATREKDLAFAELLRSSKILGRASLVVGAAQDLEGEDGKAPSKEELYTVSVRLPESQRAYAEALDRAALRLHLVRAAQLPEDQRPELLGIIVGKGKVDEAAIDRALDKFYKKTKLADPAKVFKLYGVSTLAKLERSRDPAIVAMLAVQPMVKDLRQRDAEYAGKMAVLRPRYIAALREFAASKGETLAPDANGTLRVTYGTVRGYRAAGESEPCVPFTIASQMLAKHTGAEPFDLPQNVRDAAAAENFGPYVDPELGEVPIDFLADLDITGGNSGSPTLNARGELIGLVFDGNYESMASDWVFMPEITRSIHVDIRSVLWVMDLDGADHLLKEMGIEPAL